MWMDEWMDPSGPYQQTEETRPTHAPAAELAVELAGVGEVAVVAEADAEGDVGHEGLRLLHVGRGAGRRVPASIQSFVHGDRMEAVSYDWRVWVLAVCAIKAVYAHVSINE